jgi:16S rRNA (cytosine967-C5)-methyltransferase
VKRRRAAAQSSSTAAQRRESNNQQAAETGVAWSDAVDDDTAVSLEVVRAATRLYHLGLKQQRPLDSVVAHFLANDLKGTPRPMRGAVAHLVHAMWRRRRLLEVIGTVLQERFAHTGGASREALACAALILQARDDGEQAILPLSRPDRARLESTIDEVLATSPLAVRASLPDWLAARLVEVGGEALAMSSTSTPPQTLRANLLKTTREGLMQALREDDIVVAPCTRSPVGVVVVGPRADVFRTRAFHEGLFEMQDEGSQLVALHGGAKPGERVVDGCAGAGGKTLAMAGAMNGTGTILALDVHAGRLRALKTRASRAGAHNIRVSDLEESPKLLKRLKAGCDLVVVDAPCSGTGVLRRNPDTGWRLVPEDIVRLEALQSELLDRYAALVKPGGRLVYATCSLLPEENDGVVLKFLGGHPNFTADPDALRLTPAADGTDGFFAAALVCA